jgi:hypothetical protein
MQEDRRQNHSNPETCVLGEGEEEEDQGFGGSRPPPPPNCGLQHQSTTIIGFIL